MGEKMAPTPGSFAAIHRQWSSGDRVELDLPITTRIEALDRQHPETVALPFGPLVLFAITDNQPALKQEDLLAAKRMDQRSWQVKPRVRQSRCCLSQTSEKCSTRPT